MYRENLFFIDIIWRYLKTLIGLINSDIFSIYRDF